MKSYVIETRTCPCGKPFRADTRSALTLCLKCEQKEAAATFLVRFCRARDAFDLATRSLHCRTWPTDAGAVLATLGDKLGPAGPERDRLVAELVADVNGRDPDADPFEGLGLVHGGLHRGNDMAKLRGLGRWGE